MPKPRTRNLQNCFKTGNEALHACLCDDELQELQRLLSTSSPPDIEYMAHGFGPPLHFAASFGKSEAVEILLDAGADPLPVYSDNLTVSSNALGFAAQHGHRDIVKRLWMSRCPECHIHGLKHGQMSLVTAAEYGHVAIVKDLLEWWNGWSQDLKNHALFFAARRWHLGVVNLLLNEVVYEQSTIQEALHLAASLKHMLSEEYIKVSYHGIDYINQQLLVALLIDAGANPNSLVRNSCPLICSVAYHSDFIGVVKVLLEKGADPNMADQEGKSVLHDLAEPVQSGDSTIPNETAIHLLLQHGGSVSQPDSAGECPLHMAAYGLDLRLFRLYLDSGSDPDHQRNARLQLKNNGMETLLHFAAVGGRIEVIEFLITQGLDINAINSNGWTPLMCALTPMGCPTTKTSTRAMQAAECLLSHGADASITTDEGWTPLHVLALHCDLDIRGKAADLTRELITRGADPGTRAPLLSTQVKGRQFLTPLPWGHRLRDVMADPSKMKMIIRPGLTPVYWAAERGALGVIKALVAHGVDLALTGKGQMSPARMAAESEYLREQNNLVDEIVILLLANGSGFY
ncbi:Ankyrin repeat-containing protein [Glarea lozoyensis ATCC 20868]|uniref:Ankyrin repeat-containing protein n=1 Tax=Glarea lozoyensis (strain ATCC 20868 / MF5171) TaxID=1116229 RepID=S3E369_GLAL2|nr:Ankyrin repeat-containing protein [Glarea lozoyensis ATCC 20868]EPE32873.1 Ankyrin repeat-containing protein [Glarea lozoyensis ATCC 20868]